MAKAVKRRTAAKSSPKKAAGKKAASKKGASKKAAAKKSVFKKTATKKAASKKGTSKKAVSKKGGAKKNKLGVKNSLVNNINAHKKKGDSKTEKSSTVDKKQYKKMEKNWGKDKK